MSDDTKAALAAWRKMREARRKKERRQEQRLAKKSYPSRPGGNAPTIDAVYRSGHPDILLPTEPERKPDPPKYVPQNTHTPGSIAYALLYDYWKPK